MVISGSAYVNEEVVVILHCPFLEHEDSFESHELVPYDLAAFVIRVDTQGFQNVILDMRVDLIEERVLHDQDILKYALV